MILFLGTNLFSNSRIKAKNKAKKEKSIWNWEIEPVEDTISHSISLLNQHFDQDIKDPFQRGFHLNIDWDWNNKEWREIGLEYNHNPGINFQISHRRLNYKQQFNRENYRVSGSKDKIEFNQNLLSNQKLKGKICFHDSKFIQNYREIKQKYLIFNFSSENIFNSEVKLGLTSGLALDNVNPDYVKFTGGYKNVKKLNNKRKIHYSFQAGIASTPLPLNHQFQGGGFSKLPLRGHSFSLAGTRYLTGNLEYHHNIFENLTGILFLDTGEIVPAGKNFNKEDWIIDGGFGLKYNTFFGQVLSIGIGYNLKNSDYNWHIGLENLF